MELGAEVPLGQRQIINNTFENERDRLLAFIRQRVPTVEDAEDILQDVFTQLVDRYDTIESIERVSSWLFSVARNKITDSYRKKKPTNFSQLEKYQGEKDEAPLSLLDILPDLSTGPERSYLRNRILEALGVALEKLPEDQREVFVLHEFENKSFKEISKMTGVGVNTLLSRKRYAILALRKSMENIYQEL
ncbi:MAG: RNA polymerase sigma factor [Bacteroidia bacterium]|nr:RNA polymerase sigma factor [Bacteroidia bacterium]